MMELLSPTLNRKKGLSNTSLSVTASQQQQQPSWGHQQTSQSQSPSSPKPLSSSSAGGSGIQPALQPVSSVGRTGSTNSKKSYQLFNRSSDRPESPNSRSGSPLGYPHKVGRTKSDSQAVRLRSASAHDGGTSSTFRRFAKLSVPSKLRSKSWDASLGGMDERLLELLRKPHRDRAPSSPRRKPPMQQLCLHCRYQNQYKTSRVKAEIGKAVQTIAQDMEDTIRMKGDKRRRSLQPSVDSSPGALSYPFSPHIRFHKIVEGCDSNPPDIIVSSVSSDEEGQETTASETTDTDYNEETMTIKNDRYGYNRQHQHQSSNHSSANFVSKSSVVRNGDDDDGKDDATTSSSSDNTTTTPTNHHLSSVSALEDFDVPLIQFSVIHSSREDENDGRSRDRRSSSIATAVSEAETLILPASPETLTVGSGEENTSPQSLSPPHITPPQSPIPRPIVDLSSNVPSTIHVDHLDPNEDPCPRPPLESFSSGKVSCSCFIQSCFLPFKSSSSRDQSSKLESNISSYYSSQSASAIFLEPPSGASFRSTSIDLPTLRRDIEKLSSGDEGVCEMSLGSVRMKRSKSVDDCHNVGYRRPSRMQRLACLFRKALVRSPILGRSHLLESTERFLIQGSLKHQTNRYWREGVCPNEHIWLSEVVQSGAECHVGERECRRTGEKRICAACHVVVHGGCLHLLGRMSFHCKTTFRESNGSSRRDPDNHRTIRHHWVHRWKQEGKCGRCNKSFQQKLFNRDKEVLSISCSWCKIAYHNKQGCFLMADLESFCDFGCLGEMMIPPMWILKLPPTKPCGFRRKLSGSPRAGSNNNNNNNSNNNNSKRRSRKCRQFTVKPPDPIGSSPACPLIIFVNPKSGGNKGAKLLNAFQWLLNPRQVFDIMGMKGPKFGLEMYRKLLPRLRVIVCGGDGTVGWVLSTLDSLRWPTYPPIAILPLGTGNDLARTLGWGGSYSEDPLPEVLLQCGQYSEITHLDRWQLDVSVNGGCEWEETVAESAETVCRSLPLSVFNNYFSIGADAHVALQFHQSRSANPEILNSRFKNRLFYGGMGTLDLFKRSWKDLGDFITIHCDGIDITQRVREAKFHCILFLNIPRYAGGTQPWGSSGRAAAGSDGHGSPLMATAGGGSVRHLPTATSASGSPRLSHQQHQQQFHQQQSSPAITTSGNSNSNSRFGVQSINDGKIEVLGFTSASLAAIQVGGKGERLAQCRRVQIVTRKPIPSQVDGEPCKLAPSIITIKFHSKVPMLRRWTRSTSTSSSHKLSFTNLDSNQYRDQSNNGPDKSFSPGSGGGPPQLGSGVSQNIMTTMTQAILLRIPVAVCSFRDFDLYKDDNEQLRLRAYEIGTVNVNSEEELENVRHFVDKLMEFVKYTSSDWHFLDYASCGEVFRVPEVQEKIHSLSDICNTEECLLIMDDHFPPIHHKKFMEDQRSMNNNLNKKSAGGDWSTSSRRKSSRKRRKRFSEPLKIVLRGEKGETAL